MKSTKTKYVDTQVICACGNAFTVKSNKPEIHVEVCNQCHPVFTGTQAKVARTGRVEKFNRKYGFTEEK